MDNIIRNKYKNMKKWCFEWINDKRSETIHLYGYNEYNAAPWNRIGKSLGTYLYYFYFVEIIWFVKAECLYIWVVRIWIRYKYYYLKRYYYFWAIPEKVCTWGEFCPGVKTARDLSIQGVLIVSVQGSKLLLIVHQRGQHCLYRGIY